MRLASTTTLNPLKLAKAASSIYLATKVLTFPSVSKSYLAIEIECFSTCVMETLGDVQDSYFPRFAKSVKSLNLNLNLNR